MPQIEPINIREPNRKKAATEHELSHGCAYVLDMESGKPLFKENEDKAVPIASITKLATALVLLDLNPGWDKIYRVKESDIILGGRIYIQAGEEIKVEDLFYLSLVASANSATRALVGAIGIDTEKFVGLMNDKAEELGLYNTSFVDAVGLSNLNISTAKEVAKLAQAAMSRSEIASALALASYEFSPVLGKTRLARSTNNLLSTFSDINLDISGGKTGYTKSAGYCLVSKFETSDGDEFVTVYLGGEDNWDRFNETKGLALWTYDAYEW